MATDLRRVFFVMLVVLSVLTLGRAFFFTASQPAPLKHVKPRLPTVSVSYHNREATVELAGEHQAAYDVFWAFLPTWKPQLLAAIDRYVDQLTVFADLGSWEGPALLFAASRARIALGVEADPAAYRALKAHVESNPAFAAHTVATQACISDRPETLRMAGNGQGTSAVERVRTRFTEEQIRLGDDTAFKVNCQTLQEYLKGKGVRGNQKLFVRTDLNGAESFVLPSLHDWVKTREVKPVFWVAIHEALANSKQEGRQKILDFVRLFKYCGREIADLKECADLTLEALEDAQDLLLTDYR